MEGLKLRAYLIAGLLVIGVILIYATPRPKPIAGEDEKFMEKVAPMEVGSFKFVPNIDGNTPDLGCSYKTSKFVYDALVPTVGILARVYKATDQAYDVTLIASRDKGSFHDPRVCFTSQGYTITDEQLVTVHTKTRGDIPVTLAQMDAPGGVKSATVFFYRGPEGRFFGDTTKLKFAMLWNQVRGSSDVEAVFYRFIPLGTPDKDKLIGFVSEYMDKAAKDSNGYF